MRHPLRCVAIGTACLVFAAVPGRAQTFGGWEIQWEQLRLDVKGADDHLGDVTRITDVQTFVPPRLDTKVTHEPIDLNMEAGNAFRAGVKYRGERWGSGVSGWSFRTSDSLSGRVSSPADVRTSTSVTSVVNTVLMFDELLPPVVNALEPSGLSPVDYDANGELRAWAVEGFALATLVESDANRLELVVGGRVANIRSGDELGFHQRAFIPNRFLSLHFNNEIRLSSTGRATIDAAGPIMGLSGLMTWRRLHLDVSVTESVLFGSADQSGAFANVDDVTLAQTPAGPFVTCPLALAQAGCYAVRSDWDFSTSEKVLIPVTELQLKVFVDVTRRIAVGVSSFTSIWSGVPAPPVFRSSHVGAGPGLDWDQRQRTLRFGAAGLIAKLRF
jgi:hypothetical protein